jgi:hypothetical protein
MSVFLPKKQKNNLHANREDDNMRSHPTHLKRPETDLRCLMLRSVDV